MVDVGTRLDHERHAHGDDDYRHLSPTPSHAAKLPGVGCVGGHGCPLAAGRQVDDYSP